MNTRGSGHGISDSTGDAGSSFALNGLLAPGSPEVKDDRFEIDMACTPNSSIFGKLVTALPGFRAVA